MICNRVMEELEISKTYMDNVLNHSYSDFNNAEKTFKKYKPAMKVATWLRLLPNEIYEKYCG
jgi:hypothetical protein